MTLPQPGIGSNVQCIRIFKNHSYTTFCDIWFDVLSLSLDLTIDKYSIEEDHYIDNTCQESRPIV